MEVGNGGDGELASSCERTGRLSLPFIGNKGGGNGSGCGLRCLGEGRAREGAGSARLAAVVAVATAGSAGARGECVQRQGCWFGAKPGARRVARPGGVGAPASGAASGLGAGRRGKEMEWRVVL